MTFDLNLMGTDCRWLEDPKMFTKTGWYYQPSWRLVTTCICDRSRMTYNLNIEWLQNWYFRLIWNFLCNLEFHHSGFLLSENPPYFRQPANNLPDAMFHCFYSHCLYPLHDTTVSTSVCNNSLLLSIVCYLIDTNCTFVSPFFLSKYKQKPNF